MKLSGKMCLKIILKVTKNQGFFLPLEDTSCACLLRSRSELIFHWKAQSFIFEDYCLIHSEKKFYHELEKTKTHHLRSFTDGVKLICRSFIYINNRSKPTTVGVCQIRHAPNWNIGHLILLFRLDHEDSWSVKTSSNFLFTCMIPIYIINLGARLYQMF